LLALARQFIDIALLRAKPQDLPADTGVLVLAVCLALFTFLVASLPEAEPGMALQRALLDLVVTGLFIYGGLLYQRRVSRFTQAFSALAGAGAVINLAAAVVTAGLRPGEQASTLVMVLSLLLLAWSLALCAHVFRHTFTVSAPAGALIALVYVIIALQISHLLYPSGAA